MFDLQLVIHKDDEVEGTEEYKVLVDATTGDRVFSLMGNKYKVVEYTYEKKRTVINADKLLPADVEERRFWEKRQ